MKTILLVIILATAGCANRSDLIALEERMEAQDEHLQEQINGVVAWEIEMMYRKIDGAIEECNEAAEMQCIKGFEDELNEL